MGIEEGFNFKRKKREVVAQPVEQKTIEIDRTFEGEVEVHGIDLPQAKSDKTEPSKQSLHKPQPELKIPIVNLKDI